jgi:uncharacterized MnhB-related membrane protein
MLLEKGQLVGRRLRKNLETMSCFQVEKLTALVLARLSSLIQTNVKNLIGISYMKLLIFLLFLQLLAYDFALAEDQVFL